MNSSIQACTGRCVIVADGGILPKTDNLHRICGNPEFSQELFDRFSPAQCERLVVFNRAMPIGIALNQHGPMAVLLEKLRLLLKGLDGVGAKAGFSEVEIDIGMDR